MILKTSSGLTIIIRPEIKAEYEVVNQLIYKAFSENYGTATGSFMMEHFIEERDRKSVV